MKLAGLFLVALVTARGASGDDARQSATAIVINIQRADYEGDRAALKRLHGELALLMETQGLASRVRYWRGFALWRRAMNGFNETIEPKELEQDLTQAVIEFREAVTRDPDFVDAKVGEASCLGMLLFLNLSNIEHVKELVPQFLGLLNEAQTAAPDNPRLLWVQGANQFNNAPERGGSQAAGLATYERGLELVRNQKKNVSDPLEPSWGEPELLMNLAWSNLHRTVPDVSAAKQFAERALQLVPYWHYVREILLPQIQSMK